MCKFSIILNQIKWFWVFCLLVLNTVSIGQITLPNYPDTCTIQTTTDGLVIDSYETEFGTNVDLYGKREMATPGRFKLYPVVVIINGNKVGSDEYDLLANHLVLNEYVVIKIQREGSNFTNTNDQQISDILAILENLFYTYRIHSNSPVAIVGHSVGGGVAMKIAKEIEAQNLPFNIQALSTIAPNPELFIQEGNTLTSYDIPAYLGLYGSQDADMMGTNDNQDAFTAYDHVGNELSTVGNNVSNYQGELFKSMIFIHGADHMGLIGSDLLEGQSEEYPYGANHQYLSTNDQLCITKAYLTAFLNWRLQYKPLYKSYLIPPYVYPQSIQNITSELPDYMGNVSSTNPAGSPLRMFFQTSPANKRSILNFETSWINSYQVYENLGWLYKTPQLYAHLMQDDDFNKYPFYIRNVTKKLMLGWESLNTWQHLGVNVLGENRDASDFTHVSLRIAQVWNNTVATEFINPPGEYQEAYIVLVDSQGKQAFAKLDYWGDIPFNDVRYSGINAHTAMNTISVPLSAFNNVNKSAIVTIGIIFKPNTSGLILIDNLEWVEY